MADKQENNTLHEPSPQSSTEKEDNTIVTPYAFQVSPELLGKPLATPSRRATAQCIDLVLLYFISHANAVVLGVLAALTCMRAGSNVIKGKGSTSRGKFLRLGAACFLGFMVFPLFDGPPDPSDYKVIQASHISDTTLDDSEEPLEKADESGSEANFFESLSEFLHDGQAFLGELGLGLGWAALYYSAFTAYMQGCTPGKWITRIRVLRLDGRPPTLWESFGRYGGYGAGIATGMLGFLQIFWDANRQSIQDKIAETLVVRHSVKVLPKASEAGTSGTSGEGI